jgi:predicted unusual protein kinase regulating ubiquinone biosynthesis (AarF/ABC1/UbiB family)
MVGSITSTMKKAMRDLFLGFLTRDSETIVGALSSLGFIGKGANTSALELGLSLLLEQFYGMTLGEARDMDIPEVADDIAKLLYGQPFQIPAQFAYTGRAISTLVGVSTGLAPDFNLIDVAVPYARKFLGLSTEDIGKTIQQLLAQLLETVNTLLKMPRTIERILTKLEAGQFVINLGGDIGIGATAFRRRASNGAEAAFPLSLALMFIGCLGLAAFFLYDHNQTLALLTLGLAAFLGLRMFLRW